MYHKGFSVVESFIQYWLQNPHRVSASARVRPGCEKRFWEARYRF